MSDTYGIKGQFDSIEAQLIDINKYNPNDTVIVLHVDTDEWTIEGAIKWMELINKTYPDYTVTFIPKNMDMMFENKGTWIKALRDMAKELEENNE